MTAKERLKQQVNKDRIERGGGEYALSAKDRLRQTVEQDRAKRASITPQTAPNKGPAAGAFLATATINAAARDGLKQKEEQDRYYSEETANRLKADIETAKQELSYSGGRREYEEKLRKAKETYAEWERGKYEYDMATALGSMESKQRSALNTLIDYDELRRAQAGAGEMAGGAAWSEKDIALAQSAQAATELLRQAGWDAKKIKLYKEYLTTQRNAQNAAQETYQTEKFAEQHPVIASALSVAEAPIKAIGNVEAVKGVLPAALGGYQSEYKPTDINSPWFAPSRSSAEIRGTVTDNITNPVGKLLYEAGMSALDSAVNMAIAGGVGLAGGATAEAAKQLTSRTMSLVMGSQVAADTVIDEIQKGHGNEKALALGIVRAVLEGITEKYSVDAILKDPKTILGGLSKAFAAEGTEEVAANWLNRIVDIIADGDQAAIFTEARQYMERGDDEYTALAKAIVGEDAKAFLAGGISGLGMTGVSYGLGVSRPTGRDSKKAAQIMEQLKKLEEEEIETTDTAETPAVETEEIPKMELAGPEAFEPAPKAERQPTEELPRMELAGPEAFEPAPKAERQATEEIPKMELAGPEAFETKKTNAAGEAQREKARMIGDMLEGTERTRYSPRELGVEQGGDAALVTLLNEQQVKQIGLEDATRIAEEAGYTPVFYSGLMVMEDGQISRWAKSGKRLYIQADSAVQSAAEIAEAAVNASGGSAVTIRPAAENTRPAPAGSPTGKQATYFGANAGLVKDNNWKAAHLRSKTSRQLDALGKVTGTRIRLVQQITDKDGNEANARYLNGEIQISLKANDPVMVSAIHEVVHRLKETDAEAYNALAAFVRENMSDKAFQSVLDKTEKRYAGESPDNVREELVADGFGRVLAESDVLEQFVKDNRNAAQKLADILRDIVNSIRRALQHQNLELTAEKRADFAELEQQLSAAERALSQALKRADQITQARKETKNAVTEGGNAKNSKTPGSGYSAIKETLAKAELDKLSEKLGAAFPLSAGFDAFMKATDRTATAPNVKAASVLKGNNSYYRAAKDEFVKTYKKSETVDVAGLGITARLETGVMRESLSKSVGRGDEQIILDLIPHVKGLIERGTLFGVERLAHTNNKSKGLFGYRVYNAFNYVKTDPADNSTEGKPYVFLATIVQEVNGDSVVHVLRDIEIATYGQGKLNISETSSPTTGGEYKIAQLYGVVKGISRVDGGLNYSDSEKSQYLFPYTERADGTKYNLASDISNDEVKYSLKYDRKFMEEAIQANNKYGRVTASVMKKAAEARQAVADIFNDPDLADSLGLPPDIIGNTYIPNGSYSGTEENTTVCIRSIAADALMDAVAEKLGRPLTVEDTIAISQEYWKYTDKPECLYCYVAMDRKAHREFMGSYMDQRDMVLEALRNGESREAVYEKFLDGRKDTGPMQKRFDMWIRDADKDMITRADLASYANMEKAMERNPALKEQINDALKYAQSASWAKKRVAYSAYNGHILKWKKRRIDSLNSNYGLRMYSFSDFSPAFILENMQMITDAAVRNLKVLAYTKELDFVRIFAKTGMNINISVFGYDDGNGGVAMDAMQGADWAEAQKLREQYKNVGCTFVATNDAQVNWALEQDWVDVVIPFHMVRTGTKVADHFGWKNYTAMSADTKTKAFDSAKDTAHILPPVHQNSKAKYLQACKDNNLTPRFNDWVDHPNYMKLVNETRQSEAKTKPVLPVFDVAAAKASIEDMRKRGGYYTPIGGTEENMRYIAGEIAESIEGQPKYSRAEPISAPETTDELVEYIRKRSEGDATRRVTPELLAKNMSNEREKFTGGPALKKLGVKVVNSIGQYKNVDQMLANARAHKTLVRERRKYEERMKATAKEKNFARGIADGIYNISEINPAWDRKIIETLSEWYMAERNFGELYITQVKHAVKRDVDEAADAIFDGIDDSKIDHALVINHRTATRNMTKMFGAEKGAQINRWLFEPVTQNEAERIRFINRQFDKVRTFEDQQGKQRPLNKQERELVQRVIEYRVAAEAVEKLANAKDIKDAAYNLMRGEDIGDLGLEFGLTFEEQTLTRNYVKWLEVKDMLETADSTIIYNAADTYSELFDQYYDAINEFLAAHGYQPIGFIKGYVPHLQPEKNQNMLQKTLQSMGINVDAVSIPTSIAGLTGDYKPNKKWNPYFLHRNSGVTQYDIVEAFESYVANMADVLYHTDDIMRIRSAVRYFRREYSPEEIRSAIDWAESLRNLPHDEKVSFLLDEGVISSPKISKEDAKESLAEFIEKQYGRIEETHKYNNLVTWMDNYANILAGKQSVADRGSEYTLGRKILNVGNKVTRVFSRANVAGNISSALNNSAQLPVILAENGIKNSTAAFWDVVSGKLRKAAWAEESDFLTGKRGVNFIVTTPGEMTLNVFYKPLEWVDSLLSTMAVRGAYLRGIQQGMNHEAAMRFADKYAAEVMADRSKGAKPLAFDAKNPLSAMVHLFQVEALNSWEHIAQDLPRDIKRIAADRGKKKAAAALAGVLTKMLIYAFVMNRLAEKLYGGTPAMFDIFGLTANFIASGEGLSTNEFLEAMIDKVLLELFGKTLFDEEDEWSLMREDEFDFGAGLEDLTYNISNEIPFVRNLSALLGLGDETLPLPDVVTPAKDVFTGIKDRDVLAALDAAVKGLGEIIPGGRQAVKTYTGIQTAVRGGKMFGFGENKKLQYPVSRTPGKVAKAVLFGPSALDSAQSYYASGNKTLTAKETAAWELLVDNGVDEEEAYEVIYATKGEGVKEIDAMQIMSAPDDWDDALKYEAMKTVVSDATGYKLDVLQEYGVPADQYVTLRSAMLDEAEARITELPEEERPETARISQEDAAKVLKAASGIDKNTKAIIWQMIDAGWSHKSNPYSTTSGKAAKARHDQIKSEAEEIPKMELAGLD